MPKKVKTQIKINAIAGQANPAPPIGPALGQHGVNIMEFCNQYNERTKDKRGQLIPALITIYEDRTFDFVTKLPPTSEMIKLKLGLKQGASDIGRQFVGELSQADLEAIATEKMADMNVQNVEAAKKMVAGTARSMGVKII